MSRLNRTIFTAISLPLIWSLVCPPYTFAYATSASQLKTPMTSRDGAEKMGLVDELREAGLAERAVQDGGHRFSIGDPVFDPARQKTGEVLAVDPTTYAMDVQFGGEKVHYPGLATIHLKVVEPGGSGPQAVRDGAARDESERLAGLTWKELQATVSRPILSHQIKLPAYIYVTRTQKPGGHVRVTSKGFSDLGTEGRVAEHISLEADKDATPLDVVKALRTTQNPRIPKDVKNNFLLRLLDVHALERTLSRSPHKDEHLRRLVEKHVTTVALDGASKVIPLTEDTGWVEVELDIIPSTPDEVARIIDEKNIRYIFNEWTLREKGRGVTGGVKKVSDKGNLIVVGPATRPLLEVGIPTDRSSFSSGFGEQYGRIYDSDGTIKLIYETLRLYKHPDLDYRIATIDGAVVRTDDLRNVRTLLEGTYNFEKPFEPFVPLTLTRDEAIDKALTVLEAGGIQEVVLLVSDGTGDLKGVQVDVSGNGKRAQFRRALQGQPVVPVSSEMAHALLTSTPQEPYYASPDPYTLVVDPFDAKRMMFISEVVTDKGKPFENDPRYRTRQFLQKLWVDHQQIPVVGLEPEWFLISRDRDGNPVPTDFNLYYDRFQDHPAEVQEILLTALEALRAIGISITNTTSEVAGSQHEWVVEARFPPKTIAPSLIGKELPFQYLSALRTLDDFMLYKYLLRRTAERFGKEITFEAKPFEGVNGSGMHHHLSFWKADTSGNLTNLFSDPQKIVELSPIGQSAAEGVMRAGREMFVFTNQSPADMFRHVAGFEAPVYTGFISEENRSSPIRRPKTTSASGTRFEYRVPAPDDNMYLSTGVILSAAHLGMEQNLEMRKPIEGKNIYHVSDEELLEHLPEGMKDLTAAKVPESYQDAIEIAIQSLNEGGTIAKLQDVGFLTQDLALEFLHAKKRQLAQAVRTPYPFPAETVAHDGGTKGQDLAARDGASHIAAASVDELIRHTQGVLEITPTEVRVLDENLLRTTLVYDLVREASLSRNPDVKAAAQRILREAGLALGIKEASIHHFYMARNEDRWSNLTVPAFNVRTSPFSTMRQIIRAANRAQAAFILELAKSEKRYTGQPFAQYVATAYAAAIAEGYRGPLFLQGDHFQVDKKTYDKDPAKAIKDMEDLIDEALAAGMRNIDVDPSTLVSEEWLDKVLPFERNITSRYIRQRVAVDAEFAKKVEEMGGLKDDPAQETDGIWSLRRKLVDDLKAGLDVPDYRDALSPEEIDYLDRFGLPDEEQAEDRGLYQKMHEPTHNVTMHFIRFIRQREKGLGINTPISIGVEERHIDTEKHKKYPSTVLGSMTLMGQVIRDSKAEGLVQPSKLALQTGTMHGVGGVVDWGIFIRHQLARKAIGTSVFVQHGTSTLPQSEFAKMPANGAGEAHLATEYQKISLGTIAARVPELREKMAAYLEALIYPDRPITDPEIEAKLKEAGLFDPAKREKDYAKFRPKWEAAMAQEGKTWDEILVEILGDALGGKLKGSLKDLVKELSAPFFAEIADVPDEVQAEADGILFKEFSRIFEVQKMEDTRDLVALIAAVDGQNVILPPRPFGAVAERFAQAPEAPQGEVDTTGEDGGAKQVATSLEQINGRLRRMFHITPVNYRIYPAFSRRFLSGRLPESDDTFLGLENMHPILATQVIAILTLREGHLGKAAKEASNLGIALKDLDKDQRSGIKETADLFAQAVQGEVGRLMNRHLIHVNFETKGEIKGGHEAGAEAGDLEGIRTPTVSDVIELTDGFVDGTPGSSSIQMESIEIGEEGVETFGQFTDEARALMVSTHIKPELVGEVLRNAGFDPSEPEALEKFLDPKLPVSILVGRIALLNGVSPDQMNVTILTADESDMESLQNVQGGYSGLQIDRVKGGTVQPAIAAILGVNDGRVRAFIRRSGMTEAVLKTLFASTFTGDGAISLFSVVSPNVKNGNGQWNNWPQDLAAKMSKRPDWEEIQAGKIFSSRQVTRPLRGAYTFLTDGRTDKELPFDVPGVVHEGDGYKVHTLVFGSDSVAPGHGYLGLVRGFYTSAERFAKTSRDGGMQAIEVTTEALIKENRAAEMLRSNNPLSNAISVPSDTVIAIPDSVLEDPVTVAELGVVFSLFESKERQNRFVIVSNDKRKVDSFEGRRLVSIKTPEAFELYRQELDVNGKAIITIGFKEDSDRMGGLSIVLPKPGKGQVVSAFGIVSRAMIVDPALRKVAAQLKQVVGDMPVLITPSEAYRETLRAISSAVIFRQL